MPRRLNLPTRELGTLELHVIYDYGGTWEETWRPLQGSPIASIFTTVTKADYDHALYGWTKPFITSLGLSPALALRKLPKAAQECAVRNRCPFYDKKRCIPSSPKLPWCYEPGGMDDDIKRHLSAEVIGLWREGVYVVVVRETS